MFTSIAQCAKVPFLFLEACGQNELNVFNLGYTFVNIMVHFLSVLNMNQNLVWITEC